MAELKTKANDESVDAFLKRIDEGERREDCLALMKLMKQATRSEPRMWGTSIVGFGSYQYGQDRGRAGEWPVIGFSPRKQDLTLYILPGFQRFKPLMKTLGKYKTGKSCLYLKRLSDIDIKVLKELVVKSVRLMKETYPTRF